MRKTLFTNLLVLVLLGMWLSITSCSRKSSRTTYKRPTKEKVSYTSSTVREARKMIRTKYKFGGASKSGFDCSGLVYYVFAQQGRKVPRTSSDQSKSGKKVPLAQARPGDLIFFGHGGKINHVGIISAVGGKYPTMIHSSSSKGVVEEDIDDSTYWQRRFAFVKRY